MCFMRLLKLLSLALMLLPTPLVAQGRPDIPPDGTRFRRAVEGGGSVVEPDLATPLPELLKRLESNWSFKETGKAYWIGYTDDMYSIAARGEEIIPQIVEFANKTESTKAKFGAILSIHLIGIECKIAGRFIEEFKEEAARQALLSFLGDNDVAIRVMYLLARDPWESDLPTLFEHLSGDNRELNHTLVNALFRYPNNCDSFGGTLSENTDSPPVFLTGGDQKHELGVLTELTRESKSEPPDRINRLNHEHRDLIIQWGRDGRIVWKIEIGGLEQTAFEKVSRRTSLSNAIYDALRFDDSRSTPNFRYSWGLNDPFNFSITNDEIHLITPEASRQIWLDWWKSRAKKLP